MAKSSQKSSIKGFVFFLGENDQNWIAQLIQREALAWQSEALLSQDRELIYFVGIHGPVWVVRPHSEKTEKILGRFEESEYSWSRDTMGSLLAQFRAHQLDSVEMEFRGTSDEQDLGAFVGFELAFYNYRDLSESQTTKAPQVNFRKTLGVLDPKVWEKAQNCAAAVNWARHLVNLPPNELNPSTFVDQVKKYKWPETMTIEVWDPRRLQKERMGLLLAVGQGSVHGSRMIHLRYRPRGKSGVKPIAFVGKGITFDTGGLDLKNSTGMRMMKKDMGGAACVLGLASWVANSKYAAPCDFYLAISENSPDAQSFRPSDVIVARSGLRVEIDNTDAEGRLVLADVMDVAITQKEKPEVLIDVATLTGAIKVALGAEVAGLFSNDTELAESLSSCGWQSGDWNWRMPLVEKYAMALSSPFADCKNSSEGFGSSITAALFLQKFVRDVKWAHLDIYAWTDKGQGPIPGGGANGQAVQCLITYLQQRIQE